MYIRRAQVIEEQSLELLPGVVMVDLYWILSVPGITEGVLKVFFCQHNLIFYILVGYWPRLIYVFIRLGELLQLKIGLTLIRKNFGHIQLCLLFSSINILEISGPING